MLQSDLFDLTELQLYRRRASKNQNSHLNATLLVVDLFDHTIEVGEWTVSYANNFTRLK